MGEPWGLSPSSPPHATPRVEGRWTGQGSAMEPSWCWEAGVWAGWRGAQGAPLKPGALLNPCASSQDQALEPTGASSCMPAMLRIQLWVQGNPFN